MPEQIMSLTMTDSTRPEWVQTVTHLRDRGRRYIVRSTQPDDMQEILVGDRVHRTLTHGRLERLYALDRLPWEPLVAN